MKDVFRNCFKREVSRTTDDNAKQSADSNRIFPFLQDALGTFHRNLFKGQVERGSLGDRKPVAKISRQCPERAEEEGIHGDGKCGTGGVKGP